MAFNKVILAAVEKIAPTSQLGGLTGCSVFIQNLKTGETGHHYGFSTKGEFTDGVVLASQREKSTEILDVPAERFVAFNEKAKKFREEYKSTLELL